MKYLTINSREGCFNVLNPSEKSIRSYIALYEDGVKVDGISVKAESEFTTDDFDPEDIVDEIIEIIKEAHRKTLYSSSEEDDKKFMNRIKHTKKEITEGNINKRIEDNKYKIKSLTNKIRELKQGNIFLTSLKNK